MRATEILSMIMADLLAVLQTLPKISPNFNSQREIATTVTTLQSILVRNGTSEQTSTPTKSRRVPIAPIISSTTPRSSQSQPTNLSPIGTIVRKQCYDSQYSTSIHEGEITLYNLVNSYYKVKCKDGDREEYTYDEIRLYGKSKQTYSTRKKKTKPITCGPRRHFSNTTIFIPTKIKPQSSQKGLMTKHSAFLMQQQHQEYCQIAHSALAGASWDDKLKKLASYKEIINYRNDIIRDQ